LLKSPNMKKGAIAVVVVGGSAALIKWLRKSKAAKKSSEVRVIKRSDRVNVDMEFFRRLRKIITIIVPGVQSPEFFYVVVLSGFLVVRTWFSLLIADLVGNNAEQLVNKNWEGVFKGTFNFFLWTIPAAFVNSSLKWLTEKLASMFRRRLSERVHSQYIRGVNYYTVCNLQLGGDQRLESVDQRVTVDIENFCQNLSEVYTSIFKPVLDVVVFTIKLTEATGWLGPAILYGYFGLSAWGKQIVLRVARYGSLVKHQSKLEGEFRTAHQRLIQNSEEIAFYGGADRERRLINDSLSSILRHASSTRRVRFFVNLFDEFLVKYWATIAGYATMSVPMFVNGELTAQKSATDMTRDYALLGRYLGALADSIGQLVMMLNRLAGIAGYTARVDELLTKVHRLNSTMLDPFPERSEEGKDGADAADKQKNLLLKDINSWLVEWNRKCDGERAERIAAQKESMVHQIPGGGKFVIGEGNIMKFEDVDIVSPEGRLLIRDLNFEVDKQNVMVTGPNGAGKSSLFRIIGELWPLAKGVVTKPMKEDILFVPQKPYLVAGTFRDQIIYPHDINRMKQRNVTDDDLRHFMAIVDPSNKMINTWSMDTVQDWFNAFSGGQKQRIAMARLFYHRPKYAILDECTSAVSSEVEDELYSTCAKIGITLFTVSHREYLKRHHAKVLTFVGEKGAWLWTDISNEEKDRIINEYKQSLESQPKKK